MGRLKCTSSVRDDLEGKPGVDLEKLTPTESWYKTVPLVGVDALVGDYN